MHTASTTNSRSLCMAKPCSWPCRVRYCIVQITDMRRTAILILLMMFTYNKETTQLLPVVAFFGALATALFSGQIPADYLAMLYSGTIFLTIASRVPQILKNFKNKGCGKLNSTSTFLIFAGSAARIFTTIQETTSMPSTPFILCSGSVLKMS